VTVVSTTDAAEAFFTVDGDDFVPGPKAQGPWGSTINGQVVGGLLGWAVEREVTDTVDAEIMQRGEVASRASAILLRRSEQPDGEVWSAPVTMPPAPEVPVGPGLEMPFQLWAFGSGGEGGTLGGTHTEWEPRPVPKFAWMRNIRPLIAGAEMTPFIRVASGAATLFDRHGPTGSSIAVALAQPADAFTPLQRVGVR
jgi:hypothetical protein